MAKTKKEIQEQNSEEKQDGITAGLTDSELYTSLIVGSVRCV